MVRLFDTCCSYTQPTVISYQVRQCRIANIRPQYTSFPSFGGKPPTDPSYLSITGLPVTSVCSPQYVPPPCSLVYALPLSFSSPYASSAVAMIEGGLGMRLNRMYRLNTYGSQTCASWLMNSEVGTEKTSVSVSNVWTTSAVHDPGDDGREVEGSKSPTE